MQTKAQVKFSPTPAMLDAAKLVFMSMAVCETIRPVVVEYQRRILAEGQWPDVHSGDSDSIVLDPARSYLMAEENFAIYDQRCRQARDAANLVVDDDEMCPLLVAEHQVILAKRALIDALEPLTGVNADRLLCLGMSDYKKYVELSLKLLAPFVGR